MVHPWHKAEYIESEKWLKLSEAKKLIPVNCIASWFDICGYGEILKQCKWELSKIQHKGFIELLSQFHRQIAHPFIAIPPVITEKILILNDGLARTCDLKPSVGLNYIAIPFTYYIRDLFFAFKFSLKLCKNFEVGLRAVWTGGERIQYSNEIFTGNSILSHDSKNISEFGSMLLETNFLYNPAEFQMNTAFAKAFSIDNEGSKLGIKPNNLFIERGFWEKCTLVPFINYEFSNNQILLKYKERITIKIFIKDTIELNILNLKMAVDSIEALELDMPYENEIVYSKLDA